MPVETATLPAPPQPASAAPVTLPRADLPAPPPPVLCRRSPWSTRRLWPFGPFATVASLVLHVAALGVVIWLQAAPDAPDGIGIQVSVAMTPDLGELQETPLVDPPQDEPEIEPLDLPEVPDLLPEVEVRPVEELEELVAEPLPERDAGITLAILDKRLPVKTAPAPPPEPAPAVVRPPTPTTPRARPPAPQPPPRPRGAMPSGRLRPVYTPIAYPESAREAGIEGRARVGLTIDATGKVVDVELLASSGYPVLDQAALASARQWRFQPPGTRRRAAQTFRFALD